MRAEPPRLSLATSLSPVGRTWLGPVCAAWLCLSVACADSGQRGPESSLRSEKDATVYASNGARIYYTARSLSLEPILTASAFGNVPGPAVKTCADCHDADGGGSLVPTDSGYVRTPPIAFARLASPISYRGGRAFDEATLALTLRTGIRFDGYLLSPVMPRWQMSNADMNDLIAHLKTLDARAGQEYTR